MVNIDKPESRKTYEYPLYRQTKVPNFVYFLSFATTSDLAIYFLGVSCALLSGVGSIGIDIAFGRWTNIVNSNDNYLINKEALRVLYICIGIAIGSIIMCTSFLCLMSIASRRICSRMRIRYFNCILHQDISYFYDHGSGEISSRIIKDINIIELSVGEKAGFVLWSFGTVLSGYITAFIYNPRLSGFLFSTLVAFFLLITISNMLFGTIIKGYFDCEGHSNTYIEQIFSNIRIIQSFMAENFVSTGYKAYQQKLQKLGFKKSILGGIEFSCMYFSLCSLYPMALWFGSKDIFNQGKDLDSLFVPLYNCINAFISVCIILPHLSTLIESFSLQGYIRQEMQRRPLIDPNQHKGLSFEPCHDWDATIRFQNVNFAYPSSPDAKVLKNLSFQCPFGKSTALVGKSGAGKSTIPALILREYDLLGSSTTTKSGIFINNHEIKDFNLAWLRSQFAIVTQEPQLLTGTVWENVAHGLYGYQPSHETAESSETQHIKKLCKEALIKADALDFIEALPNGMDTIISSGLRLSGGQTQRIAIARALVREPKVLILDEATSALDTSTERRVMRNLEKEQKLRQMTVIIIAHRLTTIKNADNICLINSGELAEQGNHKQLFEKRELYYNLVLKQSFEEKTSLENPINESSPTLGSMQRASSKDDITGSFVQTANNLSSNVNNYTSGLTVTTSPIPLKIDETSKNKEMLNKPSVRGALQKFVRPSIPEYSLGISNGLIVGATFIVNSWLIGEAVKIIADPEPIPSRLTPWLWYFFIVFIISVVTSYLSGWMFAWASVRINGRLNFGVLIHLLKQEAAFFDKTTSGALSASINSHSSHISHALGLVSCQLLMQAANLFGSVILVFILSWKLSVVALCPILPLIVTGYFETSTFGKLHKSSQPRLDEMSSYCNEHIDAYRTVALFGRQAQVVRTFGNICRNDKLNFKYLFIGSFSFAASQGCIAILGGLSLYWMAQLLIRDEASISTLFTSYEAVFIAGGAAADTFAFVPDISRCISSLWAVGVWLQREPCIKSLSRSSIIKEEEETKIESGQNVILDLQNVSFTYSTRPEIPALNHINLRIKEGQKIAFCGTSGSGKSTAMQLLPRLYEVDEGRVLLAGRDIRSYDLTDLRSTMAMVPQSTTLFEGTIRENICFGLDDASDSDIWEACKLANINEMINELPEKLDTQIRLKGNIFSGGQKQRLAIARALLRKPRILLLDEATSSLDSNSEAAVQEALQVASEGRTTICIAHRLSTIQDADVICVFENGEIVESGSHSYLMAQRTKYFSLVQSQS